MLYITFYRKVKKISKIKNGKLLTKISQNISE